MITCNFFGRLGNNLFQIATAASLAHKLEVDFILPETALAGHRGEIPVNLDLFDYKFKRGSYSSKFEYHLELFEYVEIQPIDNLKISGFFQSSKYFENIKDLLVNRYFTPSDEVLNSLSEYEVSSNSLGVSVRRGDYLMLQNNHCVLSWQYYRDTFIKHFQDKVDQVYIFSDDIDWCKQVFGIGVNYVEDTTGTQLFLMSKMKHLILSNSTFAWWGGYLNQNEGIIVAPDPWFGPDYVDKELKDLYCQNWIKESHTIEVVPFSFTPNMFD